RRFFAGRAVPGASTAAAAPSWGHSDTAPREIQEKPGNPAGSQLCGRQHSSVPCLPVSHKIILQCYRFQPDTPMTHVLIVVKFVTKNILTGGNPFAKMLSIFHSSSTAEQSAVDR